MKMDERLFIIVNGTSSPMFKAKSHNLRQRAYVRRGKRKLQIFSSHQKESVKVLSERILLATAVVMRR